MDKLNRKQIHARAREILEEHSGGIRWGEILKASLQSHFNLDTEVAQKAHLAAC